MPYQETATILVISGIFLAILAIYFVVRSSYRQLTEPSGKPTITLKDEHLGLLESSRVDGLLRRAQHDMFFRHQLLHRREETIGKCRLSRKERSILRMMSERDLEELIRAFHDRKSG